MIVDTTIYTIKKEIRRIITRTVMNAWKGVAITLVFDIVV